MEYFICYSSMFQTTELFMLEDKSEDFSETWRFLDRRFEDVGLVGNAISLTGDMAQGETLLF